MKHQAEPIGNLVRQFSRLPGIGEKTALRLAHFILSGSDKYAQDLAAAIIDIKDKIKLCSICFNLTETDPCPICSNPERDTGTICVVQQPQDLMVIEKTGKFDGLYHVLHGVLSPLDGIAPEDLKIQPLLNRVKENKISEVILATNPTVEGDATAVYLAERLKAVSVKATRIAHGVPAGADLEYTDEITLGFALGGRTEM